jgi:hypothetical protein
MHSAPIKPSTNRSTVIYSTRAARTMVLVEHFVGTEMAAVIYVYAAV